MPTGIYKRTEKHKINWFKKGHPDYLSKENRKEIGILLKGRKLKPLTKEHIEKIKKTSKGKHYSPATEFKKGQKFTEEHCKNIGKAQIGKPSGMLGKHQSEETKEKLRKISTGRVNSEETRKKISEGKISKGLKGEKSAMWQGGKSFEIYPQDFNKKLKEQIRKRDNYQCQECKIYQDELNYKLHIHHIDYDKKNNNPDNLIILCRKCHAKTNYNRDYWTNYFQNKLL